MVAEGKGAEMLEMEDFNQGKARPVRMRADVLLSYFDPEGLGTHAFNRIKIQESSALYVGDRHQGPFVHRWSLLCI